MKNAKRKIEANIDDNDEEEVDKLYHRLRPVKCSQLGVNEAHTRSNYEVLKLKCDSQQKLNSITVKERNEAGKEHFEAVVTLINDMFVVSPFGVYCIICEKPIQPSVQRAVNGEMLRAHINNNHELFNSKMGNFRRNFYKDMATSLTAGIVKLRSKEKVMEALVVDKNELIWVPKFYCKYCKVMFKHPTKHKCFNIEGAVEQVDCNRSWCKRWISYEQSEPNSFENELYRKIRLEPILKEKEAAFLEFELKEDENDTRSLYDIYYLNKVDFVKEDDTLKGWIKRHEKWLSGKLHILQGCEKKERAQIDKIEQRKEFMYRELFNAIEKCPIVSEAVEKAEQRGYNTLHRSYSLLWSNQHNVPQSKWHLDYQYDKKGRDYPSYRATNRNGTTNHTVDAYHTQSSLIIALDPFAIDAVVKNQVEKIKVPEGHAIVFTNKLFHRGAANMECKQCWRLFIYLSGVPLPIVRELYAQNKVSFGKKPDVQSQNEM